jgi:hypothetical protein
MVDVEVLQVVVKVYRASTEIAAKKCCMGGEDGCHVDVPFTAKRDSEPSLPLVEVRYDSGFQLSRNVLEVEVYQDGDVPEQWEY